MLTIKSGSGKDGPIIMFGLSAMNIKKLQAGMPIRIDLGKLGVPGHIYLFAGDTEESMLADLKESGFLPADAAPNTNQN